MNEAERRYTRGLVEVRADSGGNALSAVGGYAAKFNRLSQNLGGFVERLDPGFFNKSASDGWPDVLARYNHDDNMLLGTSAANTLELRVDDTGLDYTVHPPKHRNDVVELIKRGDVRQSSFAFRLPDGGDDWGMTEQGFPLRTLVTGRLVDVAPVNSPAYLDTTTGLRSLAARLDVEVAEVEAAAREGELRKFFSGPPAKVFDLGDAKRASGASDKPWSQFSAGDYTPQQWRRACLIDTGQGAEDSKSRYKLPVREPSGALNRGGCHAAASVLAGGRGGVQASAEQKKAAARKLVGLYRNSLKEDPPASLTDLAGRAFDHDDELRAAVDVLALLPADVREQLGQVLQLIAAADNAVDVAQDVLADLLGVPNPDDDNVAPDADEPADGGTGRSLGQGATHPGIDVRRRRTELLMRRLSPLEQGATHSAPSDPTNETE